MVVFGASAETRLSVSRTKHLRSGEKIDFFHRGLEFPVSYGGSKRHWYSTAGLYDLQDFVKEAFIRITSIY